MSACAGRAGALSACAGRAGALTTYGEVGGGLERLCRGHLSVQLAGLGAF